MAIILLHSSKTMRSLNIDTKSHSYQSPLLLQSAAELASYLKKLNSEEIKTAMHLSSSLAIATYDLLQKWTMEEQYSIPAIDAFLGDIYSGLQASSFTQDQRTYANEHLYILSGLYGVLRALDSIQPYRLEMGYKFEAKPYTNLNVYWADAILRSLPTDPLIINLSAHEYTKALIPHLSDRQIIAPKFMTIDSATGEPKFVVVHAKIARGSFARWMIVHKIQKSSELRDFSEMNYRYDSQRSTVSEPVFICKTFGGLGKSVRLLQ